MRIASEDYSHVWPWDLAILGWIESDFYLSWILMGAKAASKISSARLSSEQNFPRLLLNPTTPQIVRATAVLPTPTIPCNIGGPVLSNAVADSP
jgi:hypothetical protein